MVSTRLPPGFRFHPTDVELVLYYLKRKIMGKKLLYEAIADVNIYKCSPWDLPDKSSLKSKDLEWFFFCPREKKYTTGSRVKRATENGYWKTTGKERTISSNDKTVGAVKTLIFHLGQAPRGERTDWVIHEYRILDNKLAEAGIQDSYVLCKVFKKNGPGPKASAQYGAPFNEADWVNDDDDDVAQNHAISFFAEGPSQSVQIQNEEQSLPFGSGLFDSGSGQLPAVAPTSTVASDETNDEIVRFLASFADEDMLLDDENGLNQELLPSTEGPDIYNGLHELDSWAAVNEGIYDFTGAPNVVYPFNMLPEDNSTYLELDDLLLPLDCTDGVSGTHFSSPCQASASYGHENMQQLPSVTSLDGMDEHSLFANELVVLPNTSESHKSLDVLQMMDHQFYQENASYNLGFPFQHLKNGVYSPQTMERGSHLENRISRFMECVPAHLPSAAAELLALCSCGGSSIHIKAEVTHGAGECTNEALAVMMEGSSSCWCNLDFGKYLLLVLKGLLNFIEFISDLILVCCLNNVSSSSHDYYLNENLSVSSSSRKLVVWLNISLSNALCRSYVLSLSWLKSVYLV